jgi:hypothetical protein
LADWIEADSDDGAVSEARKLRPDAHICEIWLKDRLVARERLANEAAKPLEKGA